MAVKVSFSWWETWMWILGNRRRFLVSGDSMKPTFENGQFVLVDLSPSVVSEGDIVICRHPTMDLELVKRVMVLEEGRFFVQGDNAKESSDSRQFGWLTKEHICGKVVSALT
jgi:nickel-type superoxide dismutase maturation protease